MIGRQLADSFIDAIGRTIRSIASIVEKFTSFFTRRTLIRWYICFEHISALAAFPACHWSPPRI